MSSRRFPLGLRGKLIVAIVAAGALPIAIALAVTYYKGEGQLRGVIGASFKALADDNARRIGAELQRLLENDRQLAHGGAAQPAVQAWLANPRAERLPWPERSDRHATSPALTGSWITPAAEPAVAHISSVVRDPSGTRQVFRTTVPLGSSGRLIREYDASRFFDPLVFPVRFGATGHTMLIDAQGTVISCPLLPAGSSVSGWQQLSGTTADKPGWLQAHGDGHGGQAVSLVGHAPVTLPGGAIAGTGWYSFVWQDSAEILAPAYSLRVGIAITSALALGLLVALGWYASARIVAPIRALGTGARRIAGGDLDQPITIATHDEIADLARQFDDMRIRLRKLIGDLEERVDRRTRALQETRAEKDLVVGQLIQAEKIAAIGTLASGIGHEINNPLYAILSAAETIRDSGNNTQCRADAQIIVDRCKHIAAIVKNLSGYARPGDRQTSETVDVNAKLRDALALVKLSLRSERLVITEKLAQVPPIYGQPEEIQQAFFNIMRNGVQAMCGNGTLTLESHYENRAVVVRIADTGSGIPTAHLSRIFDPFFTTKGPEEGEGLGLYVVRQTLTRNGGTIAVDSGKGAGTVFTMTFRAAVNERRTQNAMQNPGH